MLLVSAPLVTTPAPVLRAPATAALTPLQPVLQSAAAAESQRAALLSKPDEFFRHAFGGRLPTPAEKLAWVERQVSYIASRPTFANNLYILILERTDQFYRVSIQRHDRQPCREWKHLQQMKNELFGASHEAVELYPAEDRLIDTCNEYHLWVHCDPTYRFPLGFQAGRCVV